MAMAAPKKKLLKNPSDAVVNVTAVTLTTASLGFFKSFFFGAAIAIAGCLQGMRAGNSSAAVGEATTRAVVSSITAVIVLDSAFAVIFTVLEI